jgi:signal transduction histidine kinase
MTALVIGLLLVALGIALVMLVRRDLERREVRALIGAEESLPTAVALKRLLRSRVHREELSAALFSREALLEADPAPVLVIDSTLRVARSNAAARAAFGRATTGAELAALSPDLVQAVRGVMSGPPVHELEIEAGDDGRTWRAFVRSYPDGEARSAVAVLVDATAAVDFREARRAFSGAVSHELRTPLQRIRGLVETLGLPLSDSEREELVVTVEAEVERMRELIDEMLLLAALDRGAASLAEGDCDAGDVVGRVVNARAARAEAAQMELTAHIASGLLVPVAPSLLEVVVGNVVDNALKHAGAGASVTVEVRGRAGEVEIDVRDTGVGIPAEHVQHVFERFFRGEAARSTAGTGLGLAIVKHIVEAHGGRVAVESRRGVGTEVRLILPEAPITTLMEEGEVVEQLP